MTVWGASISMLAGLLLSAYLHSAWILAAAGLWAVVHLLVSRQYRLRCSAYAFIVILAGLYFNAYESSHGSVLKPLAEQGRTVWVRGSVESMIKRDGDVARFFLDIREWAEQSGSWERLPSTERIALRVKLSSAEEALQVEEWTKNSIVTAPIQLSVPSPARNPHAFDYARYLHWQGVHVTGEADFGRMLLESSGKGLGRWFQQWQNEAAELLEELFDDQETAGYMKSLLLGSGEDITTELAGMYADLGLTHVLAISGLHVTLVSGMFLWSLERIGAGRKWALITTVLFLAGYVLLVGASASAVRSGMMGGVGLVCQVLGRRVDGREIWAGTLIAMLLINPYQLWHVGFQLSFAVTLGLIVFVPFSQQIFVRVPAWIRVLVAVTITAQVVSFPFLVYHFHQFSSLSWLVNLVATPILSAVVLPLGYVALVLGMLHPSLAVWPVIVSTKLLHWIHAPLFALQQMRIPFSHWPHPSRWWLCLYGVFLAALPVLWERGYHRRKDAILCLALFLALLIAARQPFSGREEVRITFLDVGQGDSIVVEIGNQKVYLMDAGGNLPLPARESWREKRDPFEAGKDVVLPFLRARGIERIDRVVMTHGDMDHIGGIHALLPRFSFGAVLVNGTSPQGTEQEIIQSFRRQGVPILTGKPGDTWSDAPGVEWTWLHPGQTPMDKGNNNSVVLQLVAYGVTVLFTGDVEQEGEALLLQRGLAPVDVLK